MAREVGSGTSEFGPSAKLAVTSEPTSLAMVGLGAAALLRRRRA